MDRRNWKHQGIGGIRMSIKRPSRLLLLALLLVLIVHVGAAAQLRVHFLDVEQAESILLQKDDLTLLIDAGDWRREDVVPLLQELNVKKIDLLILTHPHADHIGQAAQVLETFPVDQVWMSGSQHNTSLFEKLLDAIFASDAYYYEPRRGDSIQFGDLLLEVLNPAEVANDPDKTPDFHDEGLVIRVLYRQVAFLFTGDMETKTEKKLLTMAGLTLQAQILNLGHHGSRTSSSFPFLEAVSPEAAVYSAARYNLYGHPHEEVINRLTILQVPVYGTGQHGTVTVVTDGIDYQILPSRDEKVTHAVLTAGYVDLNNASFEKLQLIIHIGPARAAEIIRLREERPFKDLDDLRRVFGLGKKRIADIKSQGLACVKKE